MNFKKRQNKIIIALFCVILSLPFLDNVFHFSLVSELFEKRVLNSNPDLPQNYHQLKTYPKNFEEYFNDHYGFRKSLIKINSEILDNIFNESPSARALIGKDEWLYFDNQNSLLDAQGLAKIDDKKITNLANSLIKNWQKLQENNINYMLVIAADKTSVYSEFLPDFIKTNPSNHRIDKLITKILAIDKKFPVLDLRLIMIEAKKKEEIYQKTDTHWNKRGAHLGYVHIMSLFNLPFHKRADFIETNNEFIKGDISDIMNIDAKNIDYSLKEKFKRNFYEVDPSKVEEKEFHKPLFYFNKDENLPILFVYKDSFFDNMAEFFANHFSKSYFINEFPCNIDVNIVKKYKADYVIQEFWEGRVEEVANNCK